MSELVNDSANETTSKLSRAAANPARTVVQLVPAYVLTELVDAFWTDLSEKQYGALVGGLLLATSLVQNLVEQAKGKALFR